MNQEIKELLEEVSKLLSEQGSFKMMDLERVNKVNDKIKELLH
tara:strand:- start:1279 stop:1407 length:129 start_codon:yes stop_codon:yes gene_type:complete